MALEAGTNGCVARSGKVRAYFLHWPVFLAEWALRSLDVCARRRHNFEIQQTRSILVHKGRKNMLHLRAFQQQQAEVPTIRRCRDSRAFTRHLLENFLKRLRSCSEFYNAPLFRGPLLVDIYHICIYVYMIKHVLRVPATFALVTSQVFAGVWGPSFDFP